MSIVVKPYTYSTGALIIAAEQNANLDTIYQDYNGGISNPNVSGTAGIVYSKLNLTGNIVNSDISAGAGIVSSKLNFGAPNQGDIFVDNGSGIVRLLPGTNGQFLQTQGSSANTQWATIPPTSFIPNNIQSFTSSGTWTKPTGISKVYVKVIGAGGTGGTGYTAGGAGSYGGGGGGGGGYAEGIINVTGNVTVTIGATNSFAGSSTIQATAGSNGGNAASVVGGAGGAGGTGSGGTINLIGAIGCGGGGASLNESQFFPGGQGGGTAMGPGGGGAKGIVSSTSGSIGGSYGGGGGGGTAGGSGGIGDPGAVIVYY